MVSVQHWCWSLLRQTTLSWQVSRGKSKQFIQQNASFVSHSIFFSWDHSCSSGIGTGKDSDATGHNDTASFWGSFDPAPDMKKSLNKTGLWWCCENWAGVAVSGTTFILANTVLEEMLEPKLGTAWGAGKNFEEECFPLSSQFGRADAMITITELCWMLSVLITSLFCFLISNGCSWNGVMKRSNPLSMW